MTGVQSQIPQTQWGSEMWPYNYGKQLESDRTSVRLSDKFIEIFFSIHHVSSEFKNLLSHISKCTSPRPSVGLYTSWNWNFSLFGQNVNSLFEKNTHANLQIFTDEARTVLEQKPHYNQVNPVITSTQAKMKYLARHFRWLTLTVWETGKETRTTKLACLTTTGNDPKCFKN